MPKKILLLVGPEYHDIELLYTKYRLQEEGYETVLAGIGQKDYKGKFGYPVVVDGQIENYDADDFDAVFVPGGWAPDKIRMNKAALEFVKKISQQNKIIAAICHGPWVLASANVLKGKNLTCYAAIKDDCINAGGKYVDEICVVDKNLVTARKPDDLPVFLREFLRLLK